MNHEQPPIGVKASVTEAPPTRWQSFTRTVFDVGDPKVAEQAPEGSGWLRRVDAQIRGRDIGGVKERSLRIAGNAALGGGAIVADHANIFVERLLFPREHQSQATASSQPREMAQQSEPKNPWRAALDTGLELVSDDLVEIGGNWVVRQATGEKEAEYPSKLSNTLAEWTTVALAAFLPDKLRRQRFQNFINGFSVEAVLRIMEQIPIIGALSERGKQAVSHFLEESKVVNYLNSRIAKIAAAYALAVGENRLRAQQPSVVSSSTAT